MPRHTFSVLVENKSGVLARVSALFSRRGFNIESLAVGPTENPDLSRMTIVVDAENAPLEQITKQLNKLIEVIKIVELDPASAVQRELLMVKVRAPMADRTQVLETAQLFRARVVDAESQPLEQITKQLNKLIEVIKIVELDGTAAVQRELLLVKVRAPIAERTQVLQTAQLFRARVVDVNTETVTLEATGTPDKLQALLAVLAPLGIKEMAQSGTVALGRGPRSMSGAGTLRPVERTA
jgi:acetolactate synthase-1/3 small subunit